MREIAKTLSLQNHDKKDSTGICFIGEKPFKNFLNEFILNQPGEIRSSEGEHLGTHDGIMFYTLGQRTGLKIGGLTHKAGKPWYVAEKDPLTNTLIVVQGSEHPLLYAQGLICSDIHWVTQKERFYPITCHAKIRYRQEDVPAIISSINNNEHCVMFSQPQRAVTPGQYIVFYEGNECVGGAVIERVIR